MINSQIPNSKTRILIVDDDLVDRMACRRALAQVPGNTFEITDAETGREGLQIAHALKPDCVLLDYHLPDLNGLEFLSALRNDLGDIPVPVLMLTGADSASVAVEAMKRGAQDYLVKDVNRQYLELLPTVIERVLRERQLLVEKKQAEENLLQAEAKYRFLVEQIPAITYTTALQTPGKLLYISPQISQLGFSAEEWLAKPDGALTQIHPEDRMRAQEDISRCYKSGEPLRSEYRLLTHTGKVRWFLNEASLVRNETGIPLFLQGVLIDNTEDKKIEEELQLHRRRLEELVATRTKQFEKQTSVLTSANSHLSDMLVECRNTGGVLKKTADRFEKLYHNAPCCFFSLDTDSVFVDINDTGLEWLGHTRKAVVGKMRFSDLLTPESSKIFQESYQHFKESGLIHNQQLDITRKDGSIFSVSLYANAVKDAAAGFLMSRSIMVDISDGKYAQQSMVDMPGFSEEK